LALLLALIVVLNHLNLFDVAQCAGEQAQNVAKDLNVDLANATDPNADPTKVPPRQKEPWEEDVEAILTFVAVFVAGILLINFLVDFFDPQDPKPKPPAPSKPKPTFRRPPTYRG